MRNIVEKSSLTHKNSIMACIRKMLVRHQYTATVNDGRYMLIDKKKKQIFLATTYHPDEDVKEMLNEKLDYFISVYDKYGRNLINKVESATIRLDELINQADTEAMKNIIQNLYSYSDEGIKEVSEVALKLNLGGTAITGAVDSLFSMRDVIQDMEYDYIEDGKKKHYNNSKYFQPKKANNK